MTNYRDPNIKPWWEIAAVVGGVVLVLFLAFIT
jgi:hypothetical protein